MSDWTDHPAPPPSTPAVRAVMQSNRSLNTGPELALRRELHRRGFRFRVHQAPAPGSRCRPDILFTRRRVAVFVDGCYWHSCPRHGTMPKANAAYWRAKLERNVRRDRRNDAALEALGWRVVRVWEHENPDEAATQVIAALT
jgi:DNA mismatch endonuclease (patch repair protein)